MGQDGTHSNLLGLTQDVIFHRRPSATVHRSARQRCDACHDNERAGRNPTARHDRATTRRPLPRPDIRRRRRARRHRRLSVEIAAVDLRHADQVLDNPRAISTAEAVEQLADGRQVVHRRGVPGAGRAEQAGHEGTEAGGPDRGTASSEDVYLLGEARTSPD
jgi:hypothetical protein